MIILMFWFSIILLFGIWLFVLKGIIPFIRSCFCKEGDKYYKVYKKPKNPFVFFYEVSREITIECKRKWYVKAMEYIKYSDGRVLKFTHYDHIVPLFLFDISLMKKIKN